MGSGATRTPAEAVVLDSNVLISLLRGSGRAHTFVASIPYPQRRLSAVVAMELIHGSLDQADMRRIKRFLGTSFGGVVHVSEEISRRATGLVERYALSHRLKPSDALIAATALTLGGSLATANLRDFRFISGLQILQFRGA